MTSVLPLLTFAVLTSWLGSWTLRHCSWPQRAPRLGMWAWLAVGISVASSLLLAGLALLLPDLHVSEHMARAVHACVAEFRDRYSTPLGLSAAVVGGTFVALAGARLLVVAGRDVRRTVQQRRELRRDLVLAGDRTPGCSHGDGYISLHQSVPMVFCVPGGRRPAVVVTTAARELLSHDELMAALEHEKTHLRARHHIPIRVARVLGASFLYFGVFGAIAAEVAKLAELDADDGARSFPALKSALARMALAPVPTTALGMSGGSALQRIQRLGQPVLPVGRIQRAAIVASLMALVVTPFVMVTVPAFLALMFDCCGGASL